MASKKMARSRNVAAGLVALIGTAGAVFGLSSPASADPTTGTFQNRPVKYQTTVDDGPIGVSMGGLGRHSAGASGIRYTGSSTSDMIGYCIDLTATSRIGDQMKQVDWSQFQGHNSVPQNMKKIAWVVNHSIEATGLETMNQDISAWVASQNGSLSNGVSVQEAIAGTQAAVWSYSENTSADSFYSDSYLNHNSGATKDAMWVYKWFRDKATDTAEHQGQLGLTLSADQISGDAGSKIGPLTVSTTASSAQLATDLPAGVTIVDANGNAITGNLHNGDQIFVKVGADVATGEVVINLTASATLQTNGAQMWAGNYYNQTLVTAHSVKANASAKATVKWKGKTVTPPSPSIPPVLPSEVPIPAPSVDVPQAATPAITTTATDKADSDKVIAKNGGVVTDKVDYTGLNAGKEYTLKGKLMDKETGKSTGIKAEKVFTPTAANGSTTMDFDLPTGFAGKKLVVFETLKNANGDTVATHKDINSAEQTVAVDNNGNGDCAGGDTNVNCTELPNCTDNNTNNDHGTCTPPTNSNCDDTKNEGPNCQGTPPTHQPTNGPTLPVTGTSLTIMIALGLGGLIAGAWLLIVTRRKRLMAPELIG